MKRLLVLICILFAVLFLILNFTLPADNSFSKKIFIKTSLNSTRRFLFNQDNWVKWWPPDLRKNLAINSKGSSENIYALKNAAYTNADIIIKGNYTSFKTNAELLKFNKDSMLITWTFLLPESNNILQKISNYFRAKTVKKNAVDILENLKSFLEKTHNIYGITIEQSMVIDTALIAKRYISTSYPTTEVIYGLVQQLKSFVSMQNAVQTNPPMLHIKYDSGYFKTMVALPVNKELKGNDSFLLKRMFPGKILVTQVTGGTKTTENALKELDVYIDDNELNSPAIPFESLITDRIKEPDSTKWITKIYYPIY